MKMLTLLAASAAAAAIATPAAAAPGNKIANQYICTFDTSVAKGNVMAQAARAANPSGGVVTRSYSNAIKGFAVKMPAGKSARADIAKLKSNNGKVVSCEQDQIVTLNAPPPGKGKPSKGGGGTTAPSQVTDWGVTRVGGPGTPVSGRTAFVIDSGVDLDHPDLNVDANRSRYYVERSADDGNGHGTHVAGTIGALNNSIGVVGVAPGATIVGVKVLSSTGSGSTSGVIAGVDYVAAAGKPGDVANMSLGGGISSTLDQAVFNASQTGVKFVLAAGNESQDANNSSPARVNGANIYTVSAFGQGDNFASFSNYGSPVDIAEPGVYIQSTYKSGGYATLSGTSMAAPHLAGILMTQNAARTDGTVNNDPDGNPDAIGVR